MIGERTAGFLEYGEVVTVVLPRTGLFWEMPTKRFYYPEPREAVGIPVDAYLEDADAPIETLYGWFHHP